MPEIFDGSEVYWKYPGVQRMRMRRKRNEKIAVWMLVGALIVTGWGMAFGLVIHELGEGAEETQSR